MAYYSFGNYKLAPRDTNDVIGHVPVGVEEIDGPVPATFELAQNYPNPFNPTTDIEYTIAQSGNYTLTVYNVIGQKVRTLANDYHPVGNYRVRWDGLDNAGIRVGSGIYFYTLQGKNLNLTKKMILLK
ncbi:MAG: T9SS type A sorting domain-containing protein [Calditrichia bacterium]